VVEEHELGIAVWSGGLWGVGLPDRGGSGGEKRGMGGLGRAK